MDLLESALAEKEEENKQLRLRVHWYAQEKTSQAGLAHTGVANTTPLRRPASPAPSNASSSSAAFAGPSAQRTDRRAAKLLRTVAMLREELEEARARNADAHDDTVRLRELCREKDNAIADARGEANTLRERVRALEKAKAAAEYAATKERRLREEAEAERDAATEQARHLQSDVDALKAQHGSALETKLKADQRAEAAAQKAAKLQAKLEVETKARNAASEEVGKLDERLSALRRRNRQLEMMAIPAANSASSGGADDDVGAEVQRLRGELALREEECALLAALLNAQRNTSDGAASMPPGHARQTSTESTTSSASPGTMPTPRTRPAPMAEARTPAAGLPEPPSARLVHPPPSAATLRAFEKLAERLRDDDEAASASPGFQRFLA